MEPLGEEVREAYREFGSVDPGPTRSRARAGERISGLQKRTARHDSAERLGANVAKLLTDWRKMRATSA